MESIRLGAVAYDPKVVTIWEGFKDWFGRHDLAFDYVLYSNYEAQVAAHCAGHFDVAWNSPLAWLEAERLAVRLGRRARPVAMRDTDQDLRSVIVVGADSGIDELAQLRGRRIAVGASDSPQGTLIPLAHLRRAGLDVERDLDVRRFEVGVGLHGDHIGGERDAARALVAGEVDAACMIDGNHLLFAKEGTLPSGTTRVLDSTGTFDHCNFTVLDGVPDAAISRFTELLLGMSYDDPEVRPLLDLEGLKAWRPGRNSGYDLLADAVDSFGTIDRWLDEHS